MSSSQFKPYNHKELPSHFFGLNTVDAANPSAVRDFVRENNGHTVITSVLIANNGIAAVKEIRSVRKWAYLTFGNERAISFTVMATPEDLEANAEYIRMADQVIQVPGGTNNNNYANVELIVDIAERADVQAVWAGWGHASENPLLPESLARSPKKIVFIGPPGSAMRSLGDKISSTIVAQHAKVPCIPWSGTGVDEVQVDSKTGLVSVKDDVYAKGCCTSAEDGLEKALKIGLPVMIKASEGGGGKGIRKVVREEDFIGAYRQCESEVPGSPIFIMQLADAARHLEVQLLADQYGNNISLFGRDCSVQRRHQKIIEEAPVEIAKKDTFAQMEDAAVRLGKLVGYVSAGTVEYLYSHEDDKFYFLELNPRLQVEHPTTEMVSGVNLPAAQLQIAMGIPLDFITDIRLFYGADPLSKRRIDFHFQNEEECLQYQRHPVPKGHTTACRITSEDPGEGFKPSGGTMHDLNFRSSSNVWGYFSVSNRGNIHSFSDSQFGHIFAWGETREASRRSMVVALKELSIRGDFRTTVEYLIKLLEMEDFESNAFTTGWLDELISRKLTAERPDRSIAVLCGAVVKSHLESQNIIEEYKRSLARGQPPSKDAMKFLFQIEFIYEGEHYRFTSSRSSPQNYNLFLNGSRIDVGARPLSDGGLLVSIAGKSHLVYWKEEMGGTRMSVDSKTFMLEVENDPTQLRTPSPGKLVRFLVESGEHIKAGQPYAEVEVMKMYMPLVAMEDGIMQPIKQPGATLDAGDIIGILALDDPTKVKRAQPFTGRLPEFGHANVIGSKLDSKFNANLNVIHNIMAGYDNQVIMSATLKDLIDNLRNPELPYSTYNSAVSALHSRLPGGLDSALQEIVDKAKSRQHPFPSKTILKTIAKWTPSVPAEANIYNETVGPLVKIADDYKDGLEAHEYKIIASILNLYYESERRFYGAGVREEDVVLKLRDEHKDELEVVFEQVMSHSRIGNKNNLVLQILSEYQLAKVNPAMVAQYIRPALRNIVELDGRPTAKVVLKAREIIIQCALPTLREQTEQMEHILRSSVMGSVYGPDTDLKRCHPNIAVISELIESKYSVYDVLFQFFRHTDPYIVIAAMEVYIRRINRAYRIGNLDYHHSDESTIPCITYDFEIRETANTTSYTAPSGTTTPRPDGSTDDLPALSMAQKSDELLRHGVVCPGDLEELDEALVRAVSLLPKASASVGRPRAVSDPPRPGSLKKSSLMNTCNIVVFEKARSGSDSESSLFNKTLDTNDEAIVADIQQIIDDNKSILAAASVRRVTVLIQIGVGTSPKFFTFQGPDYLENKTLRHVNPPLAFQLELNRLANFQIRPVFSENRYIHLYEAVARNDSADKRFFVRTVITPERLQDEISTPEYLTSETNRLMNEIIDTLQVVDISGSDMNHIFINFAAVFTLDPFEIQNAFGGFLERFGGRLWRLRVTGAEIRILITDPTTGATMPIRALIRNVSGYVVTSDLYTEVRTDDGEWVYKTIGSSQPGAMHLRPVHTLYPTKEYLQFRRYEANLKGTTFVYDFPELFSDAVLKEWKEAGKDEPRDYFKYQELILDESGVNLAQISREPGANNIGMVAWLCTAHTVAYPRGRDFVVISNDITFKIGSFGPLEDKFFDKVTDFARKRGIPRFYVSGNSGARMGIAEEIVPLLKVAWIDPTNQSRGFDYLYLSASDYSKISSSQKQTVQCTQIMEAGEERYKIEYVVGMEEGLGVECLRGSGSIAGSTARAYKDIFTATLVTPRSVGIGAYLVRLGQRTVQVEGKPMLLTGAEAINKLLGREVYSSNLQLGGTQIMYRNGVTHLVADHDYEGVAQLVKWMSYIPAKRGDRLPVTQLGDTWDRDVEFKPESGSSYDVRHLIAGRETESGEFESGLFDKNSFTETLGGWAKGVVVGRARLGGVPIGVIGVEVRSTESIIPADPANPSSTELVTLEAGQVWYPNSAFKTAQAINDFNNGEQLPLMILANWRGFSGGQRDMYHEILKYGSFIVDALTEFRQPVFVYIPPFGELRGGSWVVVDPTINQDVMEIYADTSARAGVLEPEGLVGIKFRKKKLQALMKRLDQQYSELWEGAQAADLSPEERTEAEARLEAREKQLLPVYSQISIQFAELHDRPGRMLAKGCIRDIVDWTESRRYFYWRLRRRLEENYLLQAARRFSPEASLAEIRDRLAGQMAATVDIANDQAVATWFETNNKAAESVLVDMEKVILARTLAKTIENGNMDALKAAFQSLSPAQRAELLQ